MLPIRHISLFRSRWMALLWAGGICWSAVSFVTPAPDENDAVAVNISAADQDSSVQRLQTLVGKLEH